jgi:hypothetical protein
MAHSAEVCKSRIDAIETTSDCLTDRAGLALFARYVTSIIGLFPLLDRCFGGIRKSAKGLPVPELFKQLLCFFMDGTNFHLTRFDELARDPGYTASIETPASKMASSHQVKRFFGAFSFVRNFLFRPILDWFFLWRLKISQPKIIVLNLDTMVMDNDDADVREGVAPTYKKVKGFQPLQLTWGRFIVAAVFRGGSKHSNHADTVRTEVTRVVNLIRKKYSATVPIVLRTDGGFFDEKNFQTYEALGIGYICGGKLYSDIGEFVHQCPKELYKLYQHGKQQWEILPFGDRRSSWKRFRRALFCRPLTEEGQILFEFARPDTVLYTNLGMGSPIDAALTEAGHADWLADEGILGLAHGRGSDELVHRALKDFGTEQLPFQRFESNAAFYQVMLLAFNLYEAFKEDVAKEVVPVASYATTLRRKLLDVAGKVVRTARRIVLKVTVSACLRLQFHRLWDLANNPPQPAMG